MSVQKTSSGRVVISPVAARGGVSNGLIWILTTSMALAVVCLMGYWLIDSRHLGGSAGPRGRLTTPDPSRAQHALHPFTGQAPAVAPAPTRGDLRRRAEAVRL